MDKVNNFWYTNDEENINKYNYLLMFDLDKEDLNILSNGDNFVAKYTDELTKLNENEEFQSWMTYEEDQQVILNTEKKISYNDGAKEKAFEIAKKMLESNESVEKIVLFTGLSEEEIQKLK